MQDFDHALELEPDNRFAKAYLGLSFVSIGDTHQALPLLSAYIDDPATRTDEFLAQCLRARGFAYKDFGGHDKAIADFSAAIKIDPHDDYAYVGRAINYRQEKKYRLAIDDDLMAIKIDPADDLAYINLSEVYSTQKDFADAVPFAQKFVALDPKSGPGWNALCWDRAHANQLNAAFVNCQKAVTLAPADANVWNSYGYVCLKLHKNALAIKYYSRALVIKPAFASSLYGRALAEQALGDKTKAEADRVAAIKLDQTIITSFST